MGGRLELQVPLGRVSAEVVLQRPLDVDGVGIMPLDQVAVVAGHRSDETGEPSPECGRQTAAEGGRLGGQLDREVDGVAVPRPALPHFHGLHGADALAPVGDHPEVRFVGHVLQHLVYLLASLRSSDLRHPWPLRCPLRRPANPDHMSRNEADPPTRNRNAMSHMSKS